MASYFITATGTDVGKTYVTAGIVRAAREAGRNLSAIKPVLSGYTRAQAASSDPAVLLSAMGRPITLRNIAALSPWRFAEPLSPDMAAAREGRELELRELAAFCRAAIEAAPDGLLIEGVGGAGVPLNPIHLVADWIAALRIPAILVAGTYLGTISHTVSTAQWLMARGVHIAAVVLSESLASPVPPEETAMVIARFLPHPVHIIPRDLNDRSFRELAAAL